MEIPKNYNFTDREEHWRKYWEENSIYRFDENSDKPVYSVDTPPPYVSAEHLHTGHIMSYSQAEFVVRYKRMQGFNVFYPMGFDDNGLPTERFVEKKYKITDKSKISRKDFIELCLKETKLGSQNYKDLWRSLGISVDWTKTYSTIDNHSQKISQWSFLDLYKKGKVYKAKKPVLWCTTCQTAIAQADLETEERESKLNFIKAKTENGENLIFATTRPELLPACMGVSVHPEDKRYKHLIGTKAIMPITGASVPILADENVNPEYGTGVVYYCSFGGNEDIEWLNRHHEAKEKIILDKDGKLNSQAGKYEGLTVKEARKAVLADLEESRTLEKQEDLNNVTFVHERCNTDVEYISTEQWFISVMEAKNDLLKRGNEINWYPKKMHRLYNDWVESLKWDWCISRQRYYGVPFPVWYCKNCNELILPEEKDLPVDPTIDKPKKPCSKCNKSEFIPETDVMDTWMTSSVSPLIGSRLAKSENWGKLYPENLRPQAFEIIRTWLFYTIVKAHYHFDAIPFKDAMISGHGLDDKGRKISKRLGNYVLPSKIIDLFGADALRYWATGATLGGNMRWNEDEVRKGKKTVTKLWNAAKFVSMATGDLKVDNNVSYETVDKWLLNKLNQCISETTKSFDEYDYSKARNNLDSFFWDTFTDYYVELVKYRIYGEDTESKKAAVYTLNETMKALIKLYAPIMPFITEEIYQTFHKEGVSIHNSEWPKVNIIWNQDQSEAKEFEKVLAVINEVRAYKTKNGISLGKEIEEFNSTKKLSAEQSKFIALTQKVQKVNSAK